MAASSALILLLVLVSVSLVVSFAPPTTPPTNLPTQFYDPDLNFTFIGGSSAGQFWYDQVQLGSRM
jgi:hypothetical protein